jgi:hypothetical protein
VNINKAERESIMIKYKYLISGTNMAGKQFESECIDYHLIYAALKYRKIAYSLESITKLDKVPNDSKIGICFLESIKES